MDHLLLHCRAALSLWPWLLKETSLHWSILVSCNALLCENFKFFRGRRMGVALGRCAMMKFFWVIWFERNRRVFENVPGEVVECL